MPALEGQTRQRENTGKETCGLFYGFCLIRRMQTGDVGKGPVVCDVETIIRVRNPLCVSGEVL